MTRTGILLYFFLAFCPLPGGFSLNCPPPYQNQSTHPDVNLSVSKKVEKNNIFQHSLQNAPTFEDFEKKHLLDNPELLYDNNYCQKVWDNAMNYRKNRSKNPKKFKPPKIQTFMKREDFCEKFKSEPRFEIKAPNNRILYRSMNKIDFYEVLLINGDLSVRIRNNYVVVDLDNNGKPIHYQPVTDDIRKQFPQNTESENEGGEKLADTRTETEGEKLADTPIWINGLGKMDGRTSFEPDKELSTTTEGTGSKGTTTKGTGSKETTAEGTGSKETTAEETGSKETTAEGTGSKGATTEGTGSKETTAEGTGSKETTAEGTGSKGATTEGTGSKGTTTEGTTTEGTGSKGTTTEGTGSTEGTTTALNSTVIMALAVAAICALRSLWEAEVRAIVEAIAAAIARTLQWVIIKTDCQIVKWLIALIKKIATLQWAIIKTFCPIVKWLIALIKKIARLQWVSDIVTAIVEAIAAAIAAIATLPWVIIKIFWPKYKIKFKFLITKIATLLWATKVAKLATTTEGTGSKGTTTEGTGSEGTTTEGTGSKRTTTEGTGSKRTTTEGTGSEGTGSGLAAAVYKVKTWLGLAGIGLAGTGLAGIKGVATATAAVISTGSVLIGGLLGGLVKGSVIKGVATATAAVISTGLVLIGGLLGQLVKGSGIKGSQQEGQSQMPAAVMKEEHPQIEEFPKTDKLLLAGEPPQTEKEQSPIIQDSPENTKECGTGKQRTEDFKSNDSIKREKDIGQHLQQQKTERENIEHLFHRLHLHRNDKLRAGDILRITEPSLQSHESCDEKELVLSFIQKLLMMNYRARYIHVNINEHDYTKQGDSDLSEDSSDIFEAICLSNKGKSQSDRIHPMDVQMAVFHSADGFLKQLMVTKLSQCQYALPLLVPDPDTQQIEFPLWTFRQINKSWKKKNNDIIVCQSQPIYKAETPMVSFFRFGSVSSSKSQLMNSLINDKHNTFFHRNCPGSSRTRVLMDGVVEIAWFCPSGKNTDKFTDCVAFCNLHGDARDHAKQLQILTEMASVIVVLLPRLHKNEKSFVIIENLFSITTPLICLFTEDESTVMKIKKRKFKIGLKDRNQSDVSEELRRAINDCLQESSSPFRLEDVSKQSDIRVDEKYDDDCRRGREAAQQMLSLLEKKHLTEIKEAVLPHQGKLWHQWSQKNKELHRPQGDETAVDISRKQTEMMKIRQQQHECDISEFMKLFIKAMNSNTANKMIFFVKWLRILLDEHTSADLFALHHKYDTQWSTVLTLKENHDKSEQLKTEQAEFERISEALQAASVGLEHIMREIGQIYESCSSVEKNKKDLQFDFSSLPSLAAEMMISGFPLELMDGDAAHVPLDWISAVLDQLIQKLGDQRVFVLSVLGLQSSGKSTMLNAMFGLQFAVSAGRCTRGAFMQLVKVSEEMKAQMNFDYILVVDTEGLNALELAGRSTRHHDNELATFVVGLGNLTLINIFGENPSEMQDILQIVVQAFMRMKKVKLNPRCVFVHQNISDVTAGEKNMEAKRRLQKTLDKMTKLAAKEEDSDAECFSDIIKFDVHDDVKYFAQLWEGNPPMAPPNPNYCENIQELKKTIMSHASNSHGMILTHIKDRINDLWEALLNEQFVFSFRNSLEISVYRKLETEFNKWSWSLHSAMRETENKLHNKIENEAIHEVEETDLQRELKTTSEEVEKSMSEFFEKDTDADILIQWKTSFEIKIKDVQENIVRETKRKLNEILQQRDLKKMIDAQRTRHENTLLEKSKELALKLKDKANNEETLKKDFESFWKRWMEKIISDIPPIKDINIMRDVRKILGDSNWREGRDIFSVQSYSDFVQLKKLSGFTMLKNKVQKVFGYGPLSKEDEAQIRTLVTDVAQQSDRMIQSFNISKMGYNISCIQQLICYIKMRVTEHQEGSVKYKFKREFFMDLVYSICNGANKKITDQHMMFREANDPVIYVEKKREEYYSIFQKYCHRATSAAIFGEIICQKLKEPIEQSVYKKTARDLADEMRSNCESLNGNRLNLEKHILKRLTEEDDFDKFMKYIKTPRDHFKRFIRDEVSRYITDKFSVRVLPKMKKNIELLQQKIMKAAHESTEHVKENRGDAGLWLKSFTQRLSDELIFSEKDLSGVKHDDVDDFKLLEDVIRQELPNIMSDISSRFHTETFDEKLDLKFRPDEILIDHFCQCCWVQCPFCGAICTNTIENHDEDHSVPFHRVAGLNGWRYFLTNDLSTDICTILVQSDKYFSSMDGWLACKEYRKAGGVYADWSIPHDLSDLPYWKWFVRRFQKDLEKRTSKGWHRFPHEWRKLTKQDAIESLDKYI